MEHKCTCTEKYKKAINEIRGVCNSQLLVEGANIAFIEAILHICNDLLTEDSNC